MSRGLTRGYDPSLVYNGLPDPWFDGLTVGATPPTTYRFAGGGGAWTNTVVEKGMTADGLPYAVIRGQNTPTNTNLIYFSVGGAAATTGVPAVLGDTVSGWLRAAVLASSGLPVASIALNEATATFLTGTFTTIEPTVLISRDYEVTATRTLTNASATQAVWAIRFGSGTVGVPVDATVRVVFPVLHQGATPLTATVPVGALAERRHGVPTYGLTGALAATFDETVVRSLAVALDFPSGVARWNSSPMDITIGGETFFGVGALGTISAAEEGIELRSYGMSVGITGIPRDAVALALGQAYQGRAGTVWEVILDRDTWRPVADPIVIFRGRMDQMDITLGKMAEVSVKLENRLTDWERPKIVRYTDADQRKRDPNDGSFRFLPATTEKEIIWPARSFWTGRQ